MPSTLSGANNCRRCHRIEPHSRRSRQNDETLHQTQITLQLAPLVDVHADDTPQQKPNVLFIITDNLKPLLGCYGTSWIQSQNPLRSHLPDVVTVPQRFKNHGYITQPLNNVIDDGVAFTAAKCIREFTHQSQPFFLAVGFMKPLLPSIARRGKKFGAADAQRGRAPPRRCLTRMSQGSGKNGTAGLSLRTSRYRDIEWWSVDFSPDEPVFGSHAQATELHDYESESSGTR